MNKYFPLSVMRAQLALRNDETLMKEFQDFQAGGTLHKQKLKTKSLLLRRS